MNIDSLLRTAAKVISNALHPYVVLSVIVISIAYATTSTMILWFQQAIVSLACAYVVPVTYIQTKVVLATHRGVTHDEMRSFFRESPKEMIIVASLFAIPGPLTLFLINYPSEIILPIFGLGIASLAIAIVNILYRASFHLSIFSSMCISAVILLDVPLFLPVILTVLLGSSRFYLHQHTVAQLAVGVLIGSVVTLSFYYGIGLIG